MDELDSEIREVGVAEKLPFKHFLVTSVVAGDVRGRIAVGCVALTPRISADGAGVGVEICENDWRSRVSNNTAHH